MTLTPQERARDATVRIAPEDVLEGERSQLATGMVIARAWRDPDFLDRLVADPREVLTAAGVELPSDVGVRVVVDTPTVRYVHLTSWTSQAQELLPLFRELLPLPEGSEVRLIQNTEQAVCLVVPLAPPEPETLTDADLLRRLAPRAAIWATSESLVNSVQFTEGVIDILGAAVEAELVSTTTTALAETQAISLTNIVLGETESAATTTTVAAEAEALAFAIEAETATTTTTVAAEAEATAVEAEAIATTTTLAAEAEVVAVEAEAAATTTTAAAEAEVTAVEAEAAVSTSTVLAEAEAVAVAAIVLT